MDIIKVSNLSVNYKGPAILQNVSFEIQKGNIVGIIGPNGAGKSTLLKSMLGLIKYSGHISLGNTHKKHIAYMQQSNDYDLNFPICVKDFVMIGLYPSIGLIKRPNKNHWALVDEALIKVNMQNFKNHQINELSGGQFQRILVARILLQDADIIFLDEPFTGIDADFKNTMWTIFNQLRDKGKSIFMIYHELDDVKNYFDNIIIINKTIIAYGKTNDVFTEKNLKIAYMRSGETC